ncbi:MAG TPA: hypothetical protein VFO40_18850, partial [Chthoniobacterales bacterium]|nr:hypothetical protein [Chthoniobacterales bacterium]
MDWLALLFNMRGTYQLRSVFEEGVLAHQSIRRYDGWNWTGKNVLQLRNQLRKISGTSLGYVCGRGGFKTNLL